MIVDCRLKKPIPSKGFSIINRQSTIDNPDQSTIQGQAMILYRFTVFLLTCLWLSGFLSLLSATSLASPSDFFRQESQKFMIRGVYYLINQNDLNAAETEFRQAIALDHHNGEAYYFLGRIHYEQATSTSNLSISQLQMFIGKAKALLLRAQELGITYDKLHPELLSRLEQEYPKVAPLYEAELFPKKTNIIIETEAPTFDIRASKINNPLTPVAEVTKLLGKGEYQPKTLGVGEQNEQKTAVRVGTFRPEEEIQLEGDASYQLEFLPKKPKSIKHLILVGIGLTISLIR